MGNVRAETYRTDLQRIVIEMMLITRAEALFLSSLQPSDCPNDDLVATVIEAVVSAHGGPSGCDADVAAEYGAHPDVAAGRMRWALATAAA